MAHRDRRPSASRSASSSGSTICAAFRAGLPGSLNLGGSDQVAVGGNLNAVGNQTLQNGTTAMTFTDTQFVNMPAINPLGGAPPASFALSLFSAGANRFLNLELSALEADGKGKIVSSPRVITADQQKALIEQGEENPVSGRDFERRHVGAVPQGQPEARSDAANHARGQRDP